MATSYTITVNGKSYDVLVKKNGSPAFAPPTAPVSVAAAAAAPLPVTPVAVSNTGVAGNIVAPMPGKVIAVKVTIGDVVQKDQQLVVVEAMKMQNPILAVKAGKVKEIFVKAGDPIQTGTPLMVVA